MHSNPRSVSSSTENKILVGEDTGQGRGRNKILVGKDTGHGIKYWSVKTPAMGWTRTMAIVKNLTYYKVLHQVAPGNKPGV